MAAKSPRIPIICNGCADLLRLGSLAGRDGRGCCQLAGPEFFRVAIYGLFH